MKREQTIFEAIGKSDAKMYNALRDFFDTLITDNISSHKVAGSDLRLQDLLDLYNF